MRIESTISLRIPFGFTEASASSFAAPESYQVFRFRAEIKRLWVEFFVKFGVEFGGKLLRLRTLHEGTFSSASKWK